MAMPVPSQAINVVDIADQGCNETIKQWDRDRDKPRFARPRPEPTRPRPV